MVNFIIKFLLVVEKDVILVVYNRLSKMVYFIATTIAEKLARLFRGNIQKLYELLESMISNREPQFAVELTKELDKMLEIETKFLASFHSKTDEQTEHIN